MNIPVATYPKINTLYPRFADGPLKGKVNVEAGFRSPDFAAVKQWRLTEKIDGQNIRVCYWPVTKTRDFRGRSDNASLHPELLKALDAMSPVENLAEAFPPGEDDTSESVVVLFGEGYGPGIQKGGGGYRADKSFRLFDVRIGRWWLEWESVVDIARKLGIETVPVVYDGLWDLPTTRDNAMFMLARTGAISPTAAVDRLHETVTHQAEGVVATGQTHRGGDRGAGVPHVEQIVGAFLRGREAADATGLPKSVEVGVAPGDELVDVTLVADVPDQAVFGEIKHAV